MTVEGMLHPCYFYAGQGFTITRAQLQDNHLFEKEWENTYKGWVASKISSTNQDVVNADSGLYSILDLDDGEIYGSMLLTAMFWLVMTKEKWLKWSILYDGALLSNANQRSLICYSNIAGLSCNMFTCASCYFIRTIVCHPSGKPFSRSWESQQAMSIISIHSTFPASLLRFQPLESSSLFGFSVQECVLKNGVTVSEDGLVYPMVSTDLPCAYSC